MTVRNYSNTASIGAVSALVAAADTTATLAPYTGFPSAPYTAVWEKGTANEEAVLVTGVSGSTVTMTRGYDGTTAKSHAAGASFQHAIVAKDLTEANAHVNATTGVHGLTGGLVGLTDVQTLTNKTLTTPTLSAPTLTGTASGSSLTLSGTLGVTGTSTLGTATVGTATVTTLTVSGVTTLNGGLSVPGTATVGTLTTSGTVTGGLLRATGTGAATATSTTHGFQVGPDAGQNLIIDQNEIIARNNGVLSQVGFAAQRIVNVGTPTATTDAATKAYVDARAVLGDAAWTAVTFENGWSNYGGTMAPARYRKLSNGQVEIQGMILGGSTGFVAAFTLPVGYRPTGNLPFATLGNNAIARIDVQSDGKVCVVLGSPGIYTSINLTFYPG